MAKIDQSIKERIVKVAHRMDEKGLVNAYEGNISVKKDGLLYITPSGQNKAWLTPEKIAVVDLETREQIDGELKYSSELPMHIAAYEKRKNNSIGGVVHCHATHLTSYAVCRKPLVCDFYPEFVGVFMKIPVAPYGTPGTDEIHEGIGDLFETSNIVLLANHGLLAVGGTVEDALATVEAAEHSAQLLATCKSIGEPVNITGEDYEKLRAMYLERVAKMQG